jgi:hypothetical protein
MKLITELSQELMLEESKSDGVHIVGIFSSAELKNNNNRVYKKDILEREVDKLVEKVNDGTAWGELGHPPNPEINPERISILTKNLEWKNNDVLGKAKVLDTPMGQIAKTLVKEGKMGISSRGLGTVSEEGYVNEDFNLITWDLVTDPSNHPSWVNGIYEGQDFSLPRIRTKSEKEIDQILDNLQNILKTPKSKIYKMFSEELSPSKKKQLAKLKKDYSELKSAFQFDAYLRTPKRKIATQNRLKKMADRIKEIQSGN